MSLGMVTYIYDKWQEMDKIWKIKGSCRTDAPHDIVLIWETSKITEVFGLSVHLHSTEGHIQWRKCYNKENSVIIDKIERGNAGVGGIQKESFR